MQKDIPSASSMEHLRKKRKRSDEKADRVHNCKCHHRDTNARPCHRVRFAKKPLVLGIAHANSEYDRSIIDYRHSNYRPPLIFAESKRASQLPLPPFPAQPKIQQLPLPPFPAQPPIQSPFPTQPQPLHQTNFSISLLEEESDVTTRATMDMNIDMNDELHENSLYVCLF